MEMESMEEGYLARVLVADGTEGIPVGKARALARTHAAAQPRVSYGGFRGCCIASVHTRPARR
jgi:pyruvate/2-oxoglutarate dehydrogenase complex dihydrolipoamide acyltransferase (E2) component